MCIYIYNYSTYIFSWRLSIFGVHFNPSFINLMIFLKLSGFLPWTSGACWTTWVSGSGHVRMSLFFSGSTGHECPRKFQTWGRRPGDSRWGGGTSEVLSQVRWYPSLKLTACLFWKWMVGSDEISPFQNPANFRECTVSFDNMVGCW